MSNWFTKWLEDNKTCYMVCLTDNESRTSKNAFDKYNSLVPSELIVNEDNFSWQYLDSGVLKYWIFLKDKNLRNKLVDFLNRSPELNFLSQGTTKRKYKQYFHFGLD